MTTAEKLALRKLHNAHQAVPEHHINREAVRSLQEQGLAHAVQFGGGTIFWLPTREGERTMRQADSG